MGVLAADAVDCRDGGSTGKVAGACSVQRVLAVDLGMVWRLWWDLLDKVLLVVVCQFQLSFRIDDLSGS